MTADRSDTAGWLARVAAGGIDTDLLATQGGDHGWYLLQDSALAAARHATLTDDDLYLLLARLWAGEMPSIQWPARAASVMRRSATRLAARYRYETRDGFATDGALQLSRIAVITDLDLTPAALLAVLVDHWHELAAEEMPYGHGSSLLAFAVDTLLEPLTGACAYLWSVLDAPRSPAAIPEVADPEDWRDWSILSGDDWNELVGAELTRLGRPQPVPDDGDEAAALLASARAGDLATYRDVVRVAASIVRTSGWPGEPALTTQLAERAVSLALPRISDIDPGSENEQIVDAVQRELLPSDDVLISWARDPSFGRLNDGDSRTGDERLRDSAGWLTWSVSTAAVEAVAAIGAQQR
jgi:hypothetical protein